ncbi:phosphate ABC transporter permease subunit PstC [Pseudomonas sp. GX19020]|uniref:phosphate ABC transporter permease subunit PstC n=1 Tax=Pseudomonadota TaxID=1224 RepID=UPI000897B7E0|nr:MULTISPECIES: phosphate ABC transporter permease subunit PstC [Pseudomonadota]MCL4065528.1 phosphate ABC transporter permease subunit PstC [Pseudomonas sp. GX19020]SEB74510.1 phosphate ABC transporter membrane protein 1, PhoT family [Rhodobacter sp. 24-YEA-8]
MTVLPLLMILAVLAAAGFILGRQRALALAGGETKKLHSLPAYYGWHAAIMAFVPAFIALIAWLLIQPFFIESAALTHLPAAMAQDTTAATLAMSDVRKIAGGLDGAVSAGALDEAGIRALNASEDLRAFFGTVGVALAAPVSPEVLAAAIQYRESVASASVVRAVVILLIAVAALAWALKLTAPDFWARNRVEKVVLWLLMLASLIAILTTVGIIWSLLSESFNFFSQYPIGDFFFGLTWNPKFGGGSDLGFIPLFWGTIYITIIALLVAVPLGLFAAIYLAEYASRRTRAWVKPMIEVIAGIPTVVYGLFALITVGPFLRDFFSAPMGLGNSAASVMTAGIVIGLLNIPFISSLSDDIINAVPQSLRDGAFGLGSTKSETIRQVVLPAALPGIAGAILMGASRAIGETMIVVMGAGAAAKLSLNPFEAMTTMTVKIVGQLTGDTDFNSPETLVAFALGMTLFVITLLLNVMAVWIVRKYREQYE